MKAGCFGPCPALAGQKIPEYMVLAENRMAILNDNSCFAKFAEEVGDAPEIETVYLVTDSDADYRSMARGLNVKQTYQLYRDYLDNFRINSRR
jgi:adenine-specific DNA-methyltransferase